jgi:hypothetical protein
MDTVRTPEAAALIAEVGWYATTDTVIGEDREILSPHAVARLESTSSSTTRFQKRLMGWDTFE